MSTSITLTELLLELLFLPGVDIIRLGYNALGSIYLLAFIAYLIYITFVLPVICLARKYESQCPIHMKITTVIMYIFIALGTLRGLVYIFSAYVKNIIPGVNIQGGVWPIVILGVFILLTARLFYQVYGQKKDTDNTVDATTN